jgi:glycosyltransferase involved in cell wall biosynthesis
MTQSRRVRVLQLVDTLGMGGAETWLMEVLRIWSRTGAAQMDFVATSGNVGIFDEEAQRLGARISYLRYGKRELARFVPAFRRVLRDGRYDAMHDHQDFASGWHFLMGAGELPPVRVTHVHNPSYQIRNNYGVTLRRRMTATVGKRLVSRYATHIAGTSKQAIREHGFDAPAFAHISKAALHCGFDPARFRGDKLAAMAPVCEQFGWGDNAKIILYAGRIDQSPELGHPQNHKNSGFAVDVAIEAARRDRTVCTLFAGKPSPAVAVLERRIADAGFAQRIRFAGIRMDIERLMLASDVLLFPSRGEGLGMVAVEAQAAGLPVLASSSVPRECVVVPDLVHFLDVKQGAGRWADELLELARTSRDISRANASVSASPFSIENSARALLQLYGEGVLA